MSRRLYPVEVSTEPDGTTLLCASRRDVPLVCLSVECDGGRLCDPRPAPANPNGRDLPGLAALVAALIAEGPEGHTPLAWHRELDKDAIDISVDSAPLHWVADLQCLPETVNRATNLLRECLARPGMDAQEWKQLVKTQRVSAREHWAQPTNRSGPLVAVQMLGYGYPHAHPAFERGFARAKLEDARRLGRGAFHRGPRTIATIGGDIEPNEGFAELRALMASLPGAANADRAAAASAPPAQASHKPVWIVDWPGIDQVFFALGRPGVRAGDPDRVALRMANYAIGGGGFSSRLLRRVRSQSGHTYGIHSDLPEDFVDSPFTIECFTQTANLSDVLNLIDDELRAIRDDGFTDAEVQATRAHLHGAVPLGLTTPDDVLDAVSHALRAGLSVEDLEEDWGRIMQTDRDLMNGAARRLLGDGSFRLALVGPADEIRRRVQDRGEHVVFKRTLMPDRWRD